MKPSTLFTVSVILNAALLVLVLGLVIFPAAEQAEVLQQPYSKADYRMYEASVSSGLSMNYKEYLTRKYPREYADQRSQRADQRYWLKISPVTERAAVWQEEKAEETGRSLTYIFLTPADLKTYPLIAELFVADVPFPEVAAFHYEAEELAPLTGDKVIIVWNGSFYSLDIAEPNKLWW